MVVDAGDKLSKEDPSQSEEQLKDSRREASGKGKEVAGKLEVRDSETGVFCKDLRAELQK